VKRLARGVSKLAIGLLEGTIEGAVEAAVKSIGVKRLKYMIRHGYLIISSIFYGLNKMPVKDYINIVNELIREGKIDQDYIKPPEDLSDEEKMRYVLNRILKIPEIKEIEGNRRRLRKTVIPIFGMARSFASRFPPEYLDNYLTGEWLYNQIRKRFPDVAKVIDECGEEGRKWLENQAWEIRMYLTGRLVWDQNEGRFISKEEYIRRYGR